MADKLNEAADDAAGGEDFAKRLAATHGIEGRGKGGNASSHRRPSPEDDGPYSQF
jgi:hypothetical protein